MIHKSMTLQIFNLSVVGRPPILLISITSGCHLLAIGCHMSTCHMSNVRPIYFDWILSRLPLSARELCHHVLGDYNSHNDGPPSLAVSRRMIMTHLGSEYLCPDVGKRPLRHVTPYISIRCLGFEPQRPSERNAVGSRFDMNRLPVLPWHLLAWA